MNGRRLGTLIAVAGLFIGLVLATRPLSYRAVEANQTVDCGIAFAPKNPPPPEGSNDECDAAHTGRWVGIIEVVFAGAVLGSLVYFVSRQGRKQRVDDPA